MEAIVIMLLVITCCVGFVSMQKNATNGKDEPLDSPSAPVPFDVTCTIVHRSLPEGSPPSLTVTILVTWLGQVDNSTVVVFRSIEATTSAENATWLSTWCFITRTGNSCVFDTITCDANQGTVIHYVIANLDGVAAHGDCQVTN